MDAESGDDDVHVDDLTSEWGGESRQDWRGWWNESGSWFQRLGDAYLNERYAIFNKVHGWERVTTDEERVLRVGCRAGSQHITTWNERIETRMGRECLQNFKFA